MTTSLTETAPSTRGRILAVLYLFVIATGIIAQSVISDGLIVQNDAAATAANIRANATLYRIGFTIFLLEMVAQVGLSAMFYDLLKPVNRSVARTAAIIGITGSGIKMFARVFYCAPLLLLSGASYLSVFSAEQLETLSLFMLRLNSLGAGIALVFFGFETFLRGWLLFRSTFLPRFLGVISMTGGLGWITFLWPPLGSAAFMGVALVALVGVIATTGWLLIRGVDDVQWSARAALANASIWR